MTQFSKEQLEKLKEAYSAVSAKYESLLLSYTMRTYENPRANEYAKHGFSRRLKTLVRWIVRVFEIVPPDRIEIPTKDEISDAVIYIQAFVFNAFGCADNLAWIWVKEKGLTKIDGRPFPSSWVGLRSTNKEVRRSFSPDFQTYLHGLAPWFDHLEKFRHALAHRIPFYIPPYTISPDKMEAYQLLGEKIEEANKLYDIAKSKRLSAEQMKLAVFNPIMTHSFEEQSKFVVFHAQLLADFNTIEELGRKMLEELDR